MEKEPLEHAIRCWAAEEENASRIASRKTLIVGLPAGLLAFVGLSAESVSRLLAVVFNWGEHPNAVRIPGLLGALSLAGGLACLFVSMALAVGVRRRDPEHRGIASEELHVLSKTAILDLARAEDPAARGIAYARTVKAARTLLRLNQEVEERLYDAIAWLLGGVAFSFLALLAYAWVSS